MNDRRDHYPNYTFEYKSDDDVLDSMFWADETQKAYYAEFVGTTLEQQGTGEEPGSA